MENNIKELMELHIKDCNYKNENICTLCEFAFSYLKGEI